jgi:hypothetical protein
MAVTYATDLQESNPAPGVWAPSARVNGKIRINTRAENFADTAFNEAGDTVLLCAIPSGATLIEASFGGSAQAAGGLFDFGFCDRNGGDVRAPGFGTDSRERLANAVDVSGALGLIDRRFTALAGDTVAQRIWELLGYTSDPAREWFLCIRVQVAGATPEGDFTTHRVRYVND